MTDQLTLDYGMRFTHHGPQYDEKGQASNFFPDKWSASQAPLLYHAGLLVGGAATAAPRPTAWPSNPTHRRVARSGLRAGDRHDRAEHRAC